MPAPSPPRVPTLSQLWRDDADLRRALAMYAWDDTAWRARLVRTAAAHFHMREKTLRECDMGLRRIQALPSLLPALLMELATDFLLHQQARLLATFLDHLDIEHEAGRITAKAVEPESTKLQQAIDALAGFDPAIVRLYLTAFYWQQDKWPSLGAALAAPPQESESGAAPTPGILVAPPPPDEYPTTLDNLLIQTAVASITGVEGALDPDQLLDLVGEVVDLNPSRHRSYFHRGYIHALRRMPLDCAFEGVNPGRKAWYMAGAVVALARYQEWAHIVQLYRDGEFRDLGGNEGASVQANRFVARALLEVGSASETVAFFRDGVCALQSGCHSILFDNARRLMQATRFADAEHLLNFLLPAIDEVAEDPDLIFQSMYWDIVRLQAHCSQWQRAFDTAIDNLLLLLKSGMERDKAATLTDLALALKGFRGLYDIQIGIDDIALKERLETLRNDLATAVAAPGEMGQAHAHFVLGVADLLSGDLHAAARHLETALARLRGPEPLYRAFELPQRCSFYLGTALLNSMDTVRAGYAVDLIESSLRDGFKPPPSLLRSAAEGLITIAQDVLLERLAATVERCLGNAGLDVLVEADRPACGPLLTRLLRRGMDETRRCSDRMRDLLLTLHQTSEFGLSALQAETLDGLEQLAREHPDLPETNDFLIRLEAAGQSEYDPHWTPTDAAFVAADLHELRNEPDRAALCLESAAYRVLHDNRFGSAEEATEIADRIDGLKVAYPTQQVRGRIPQPPMADKPMAEAPVPVRIAVVGGDQLLSANRDKIRAQVKKLDPAISVEFRVTNWNSNIGPELDAMRPALQRCQMVVVLQRIRTNMGCLLRREFPWMGCASYSPTGIAAAILRAAAFARKPARQASA